VYADLSRTIDEDSPVLRDVDSEEIMEHYGELKAMCERVVQERPGAIVRPGLIVGPHDPTGRFTYWPHRMSRGGDVLAPGPPEEPVTLIDVRDLGEWLVRLCASQTQGVFNAIERTTWRALLEACVREVRPDARLVWVQSDWLSEQGVGEWMELPVWTGPQSSEHAGLHRVANERAVAAGLTFRPLEETVRATLVEAAATDDAGLKPEREAELLAEWASLASGA
jgi:2'-hydroxyisoflavone reductase